MPDFGKRKGLTSIIGMLVLGIQTNIVYSSPVPTTNKSNQGTDKNDNEIKRLS